MKSAIIATLFLAGCSSILGFKEPSLQDNAPDDAAVDAMTDAGGPVAKCKPAECPFGCDTTADACRDGALWIFLTAGAFHGDGFGGTAGNAAVRAGADALCRDTYSKSTDLMKRQCNLNRVHAVVSVNTADAIELMSSNTAIMVPTTVPVQRGDDAAVVANNWNDFTDINTAPRVAPAPTATSDQGLIWTGFKSATNCSGWTSEAASGVQGNTNLTAGNWLQRSSTTCDTFARLLCVCWAGGE